MLLSILASAASAAGSYTVNAHPVATEIQQLLRYYQYPPGDYYIDVNGNFGQTGTPPAGNIYGGPVNNWRGEPKDIANNPIAQAYVNGVAGVRVFWVYSPSIFSGATGGASGYYHLCPGNRYFRSSEGAINVGGSYDPGAGGNGPFAGATGTNQGGGQWTVIDSPNGPLISLSGSDGSRQIPLSTLLQGKWKMGQTSYAAEVGKASCP